MGRADLGPGWGAGNFLVQQAGDTVTRTVSLFPAERLGDETLVPTGCALTVHASL